MGDDQVLLGAGRLGASQAGKNTERFHVWQPHLYTVTLNPQNLREIITALRISGVRQCAYGLVELIQIRQQDRAMEQTSSMRKAHAKLTKV